MPISQIMLPESVVMLERAMLGVDFVPVGGAEVSRRIDEGFRFIACGIDTEFLLFAARHMLHRAGDRG